ncbi:MAG: proline--tRNA ligase [Deltaproteobacteria bacterium]|nr:MAG: proline--tRNA ligase [Deltaproteobacteria bacterium]
MRYSQYLLPTLRETPGDADVVSQQLMMRAGMIRKVAAGIYDYLPLGLRAIRRMETIVREEMNRAGAIEVLMPMVVPAELWEETGRWQQYGRELLRLKDRKETDFCLGPTHEEVITELVRGTVRSYRQLPLNLYQIQSKFRDEIRPRFGLMRGREFIMKDAYSFDLDQAGVDAAYDRMYQAYRRIFARCGLNFRAVEADTGNIGGSSSHEFMVLAESGEDAIASCSHCEYAANVEKAECRPQPVVCCDDAPPLEQVATPGRKAIGEVAEFLGVPASATAKALVLITDGGEAVMALLRGDHELNPIKLKNVLGCAELEMATDEQIEKLTGAPVGYLGPVGAQIRVVADLAIQSGGPWITGANVSDAHLRNSVLGRDFTVERFADIRNVEAGDPCPRCAAGRIEMWRGIEVGHVFKLGTKYSAAMRATVLDDQGQERTLVMGCYGIGIGRTVAAAIEQNHDDKGIVWPMPLAPFQVLITLVNPKDETVRGAGEQLYLELQQRGVEVLLDDRDERPGSKFADADLLGMPLRVTVGSKALAEGAFELQERRSGARSLLPLAEAADRIAAQVRAALATGIEEGGDGR